MNYRLFAIILDFHFITYYKISSLMYDIYYGIGFKTME